MLIRRMEEADAASAAYLAMRSMPQPWSEAAFAQEIKNPQALVLCAVSDGADGDAADACAQGQDPLLGFLTMQLTPDDAELTGIAADPKRRRRGIGTALLREARVQLARREISRIVLEVRASNAPAIAFYEKYGFTCIGVRKGFYDAPKEDALVMTDMKE